MHEKREAVNNLIYHPLLAKNENAMTVMEVGLIHNYC